MIAKEERIQRDLPTLNSDVGNSTEIKKKSETNFN